MELQQIRYFLALKRTLNFSEAAKQCNVTQPALTRAVQRLEQNLGGELIHREGRLTHLSDLGKAVLPMLERTSPQPTRLPPRLRISGLGRAGSSASA